MASKIIIYSEIGVKRRGPILFLQIDSQTVANNHAKQVDRTKNGKYKIIHSK